jgi:hypothetical protein
MMRSRGIGCMMQALLAVPLPDWFSAQLRVNLCHTAGCCMPRTDPEADSASGAQYAKS